ncbi:MAG: TonB-dependent receptor [Methylococcaceae bacterium]|nr:TonB-dependent receptor [Methylococcaceae bacterium]
MIPAGGFPGFGGFARCLALIALLIWLQPIALSHAAAPDASLEEIQQLGEVHANRSDRLAGNVTSVGKKTQRASEAAAAVFVITQDDIRRSGVTSIVEALRLAPGVHVARVDASHWAVSARGSNGVFANKLLVLMDGREVYASSFGGVYWDVQDQPLEDIDRIEVIRGPGASLWGANAVNGVINIISKSSRDTLGGSVRAGGGNLEQGFGSFRYGVKLGDQTYGRVYAKGVNRGAFDDHAGGSARDAWSMTQSGFRVDHDNDAGRTLTLLGGAYQSQFGLQFGQPVPTAPYSAIIRDQGRSSGFNLLGRWREALSLSSEFTVQAFLNHDYRREPFAVQERTTLDLEFQHRFLLGDRHDVNWGMGYRLLRDAFGTGTLASIEPASANKQLASLFVQDDIGLIDNELKLTLGAKLQHNDYTGFEGQPSGRLLWTPTQQHSVWLAVSRAVRTPNRADCCLRTLRGAFAPDDPANPINQTTGIPKMPLLWGAQGSSNLSAERVIAYEMGYRFTPHNQLSVDLALFYNRYTALRSWDVRDFTYQFHPGYIEAYLNRRNSLKASSWGSELAVSWKPLPFWSLDAVYSYLNINLEAPPTALSFDNNTSPRQQASLRSAFNLTDSVDLDFWLRYADPVWRPASSLRVDGYLTLDTRLAWRPFDRLELSVVGQNLLEPKHAEFRQEVLGPSLVLVPRSYYLQLNWQF